MPKFGPGTLIFGSTGSEFDVSCAVNSLTISPSKNQGDSRTMLCGTVKPGATTYEYALSGNLDIDSDDPAGFFRFTQENAGTQTPFVFVPNTPSETAASGVVVVDPLEFGGDEYGADMASDIEFSLVGAPTYTYPAEAGGDAFARTVTNGGSKAGTVSKDTAAALAKLRKSVGVAEPSAEPAEVPEK